MSEQIVSSSNIFVCTDRGSANSVSKGDDYELNLNSVGIDADKGQIIRLTVNNFSMYKTFTNVNAHNSAFILRNSQVSAGTALQLPHQNHDTIHKIAVDFAEEIRAQLLIDASNATGGIVTKTVADSITPLSGTGVAGTSNNVISFKIEFRNSSDQATAHNLTDVRVQFYEKVPIPGEKDRDSDVFSLLGGDRISTPYSASDTTDSIIVDATNANYITFTCKYPAQRHTEQFVYLRTNLTSNSLATSSLEAGNHSNDVTNVHHTNILGKFVIDTEVVQYAAGTGREYFIDINQRHINNIRLYLTDHHGRPLSTFAEGQNTLGNLNFNLVLRCDIIQKRAPNEGFTQPVQRTAPARFANPYLQQDGHTRT